MKSVFQIKGLDCANCATQLENMIQKMEGVENVSINFITQKMILEWDCSDKEEFMKRLKKTIKKEEPDVKIEEM